MRQDFNSSEDAREYGKMIADIAWLSEHPDSPLKLAESALERAHVATIVQVLDYLTHLDCTWHCEEFDPFMERLCGIEPTVLFTIEHALESIGANRALVYLRRLVGQLLPALPSTLAEINADGDLNLTPEQRLLTAVDRAAGRHGALFRWYNAAAACDVELLLWNYIRQLPSLRRYIERRGVPERHMSRIASRKGKVSQKNKPKQKRSATPQTDFWRGQTLIAPDAFLSGEATAQTRAVSGAQKPYSIVFFLETWPYATRLPIWLANNSPAYLYGENKSSGPRLLKAVGDAKHNQLEWRHMVAANPKGQNVHEAWHARAGTWRAETFDAFACLAEDFQWSIVEVGGDMQQSLLAFTTTENELRERFVATFKNERTLSCPALLSVYQDVFDFDARAHGVIFYEQDRYGEAALIASSGDSVAPWIVLELTLCAGHAWREACKTLQCVALGVHDRDSNCLLAVYRADNEAAFRQLWQRFEVDGVAIATVCGHADPHLLLREIKTSARFHSVQALSKRTGWAYQHAFGGGSTEHVALFHAQDPATNERVCAFVEKAYGARAVGRW